MKPGPGSPFGTFHVFITCAYSRLRFTKSWLGKVIFVSDSMSAADPPTMFAFTRTLWGTQPVLLGPARVKPGSDSPFGTFRVFIGLANF